MSYVSRPVPPAHADRGRGRARIRRAAKALVSSSDRVLLVEECHATGGRFWTFPGGGVRPGEELVDGLRRELREELRCDPVVQNAVSSYWYVHESVDGVVSLTTIFSCALRDRVAPVRSEGIVDTTWAPPGDLPAGTLPQVRQLIERRFESEPGTSPRQ